MNKKMLFLAVMLLCVVFVMTGCFGKETTTTTTVAEQTTTAAEVKTTTVAEVKTTTVAEVKTTTAVEDKTTAASEEPKTRTIVDMQGRTVEIPAKIERVVNNWPSSNSVMLMIGAGDLLVGTTTTTVNNAWNRFMYPNLVNVPTDISNVEDVLKLNPDLYISSGAEKAEEMQKAGIPSVVLMFSNYDDMKKSFTILGEILGGEYVQKMEYWCEFVDTWKDTITTRLADLKEEDKPVLYYCAPMGNGELTTTFKSPSMCQDWANICGAVYLNDLTDNPGAGTITVEEVLKIDPDVMVIGGIYQADAWAKLQEDKVWAEITAVKEGRVYVAPKGMHPIPRFGIEGALMLPWTAKTLWPEKFADVDLDKIFHDFYYELSGKDLTAAEVKNLLAGFDPDDPYGATAAAGTEQPDENATRTIVDMAGRTVEIPAKVERVVNSWPSSNSVMLMIGAGDLLVGTTTATVNNEWNKFMYPNLVNIPTDISNVEDVLKLEPDLYIATGAEQADKMQAAGIPSAALMFSSYDDMKKSFTILGEILGGEYVKKMEYWCEFVDTWKATITTRLADLKEEDKPVLYYCAPMSNGDLTTTFASNSICSDWANTCGAIYMGDLTDNPAATTITAEEVLKLDPDVMIIGGIKQADAVKNLETNVLWHEIKAYKEGRVYVAPRGMHPIPRFGIEGALMLPWCAKTLWPEKFEDVNLEELFHDFYYDLSGVDLTDAQVKNLLAGFDPHDPYGASAVGK